MPSDILTQLRDLATTYKRHLSLFGSNHKGHEGMQTGSEFHHRVRRGPQRKIWFGVAVVDHSDIRLRTTTKVQNHAHSEQPRLCLSLFLSPVACNLDLPHAPRCVFSYMDQFTQSQPG